MRCSLKNLEQKELYDRIDDAVCAVRSALEEGILPGGGTAYLSCSDMIDRLYDKSDSKSRKIACAILSKALLAPWREILINAGIPVGGNAVPADFDCKVGINAKTGEEGDMIEMGIIDPVKVAKEAITNAISVATTILSTNAIITMARTYDSKI